MRSSFEETLSTLVMKHEGLSLKPYLDPIGKLTIGYGRNLDSVGISENEAQVLLKNDLISAFSEAHKYTWFVGLSPERQVVITSMLFNLGALRFSQFQKMIKALEKGDFAKAADEMLCSVWASQVGARATELAQIMRLSQIP